MLPAGGYDSSLTRGYVRILRDHVIAPLHGSVGESCFAAAMLVFAGVDGLGKLIHPNKAAMPGPRCKGFLPRLGPKYGQPEDPLWELRNSLAHNAMNVACYMSALCATLRIPGRPGPSSSIGTEQGRGHEL